MKDKKEKKKKPNKRLAKAMEAYFDVSNRIGITDDMDDKKKISLLLKEGMEATSSMLDEINSITEEDYSTVSDMLGINVSKQQYKEFVTIMTKIRMGKFTEKNREKYEENVKQKMFDQCMREKFLDSVINSYDETMPIPEWSHNMNIELEGSEDKEFDEILNTSIERSMRATEVHKEELIKLGLAFEYVTKMKYTAKDFKLMLDWKYYCGGVPSENSKPKLFDLMQKFMIAVRLGEDFGLPGFEELFNEMGMKVELSEPMPQGDHFQWWSKDLIDKYCPLIKDDYYEWLSERRHSDKEE